MNYNRTFAGWISSKTVKSLICQVLTKYSDTYIISPARTKLPRQNSRAALTTAWNYISIDHK